MISNALRNLAKVPSKNVSLFLCDMQEKFRNNIVHYPEIIANSARILQSFNILNAPIICTEQYPKGLGPTVSELDLQKFSIEAVPKTQWSMCVTPVLDAIKANESTDIVVCGIEAHVCVLTTTLELIDKGFNVHIVADAISSRSMTDRIVALERMRDAGACITTTESVILALAGGSHHPQFKALQKIIMTSSADTGLLPHLKV